MFATSYYPLRRAFYKFIVNPRSILKERKSLSTKKRDVTITEALKADNASCRLQTSNVQVVEDFLKAGVPLYKIDKLRDLLERGGNRLTESSHLRQHILLILKQETERLKEEKATRYLGLIFNGSNRLGKGYRHYRAL